jgi:FeoB-associated Cys-rich membrane protein
MNIQEIIVLAFVGAAVIYVAWMIYRKTRSLSSKTGCANDCGCSTKTKEPRTAA